MCRNKFFYMVTAFFGQVVLKLPEITTATFPDGIIYITDTTVIGGYY